MEVVHVMLAVAATMQLIQIWVIVFNKTKACH